MARAGGVLRSLPVNTFNLDGAAKFVCYLLNTSSLPSCRRVRARLGPEAGGATLAAAPADLGMMPLNGNDQAAPLVDACYDSSIVGFGISSSDWLSGAGAMAAAAGGQTGLLKALAAAVLTGPHSLYIVLRRT